MSGKKLKKPTLPTKTRAAGELTCYKCEGVIKVKQPLVFLAGNPRHYVEAHCIPGPKSSKSGANRTPVDSLGPRESHKASCEYRDGGPACTCSRGPRPQVVDVLRVHRPAQGDALIVDKEGRKFPAPRRILLMPGDLVEVLDGRYLRHAEYAGNRGMGELETGPLGLGKSASAFDPVHIAQMQAARILEDLASSGKVDGGRLRRLEEAARILRDEDCRVVAHDCEDGFLFEVKIGKRTTFTTWDGGLIYADGKPYFLMGPGHGVEPVRLYELKEVVLAGIATKRGKRLPDESRGQFKTGVRKRA